MDELVGLLKRGTPTGKEAAALALANLALDRNNKVPISGGRASAYVYAAGVFFGLRDKNARRHETSTADAQGIIRRAGTIPVLVRILKTEASDETRAAAANALCNLSFSNESKVRTHAVLCFA